MKESLVRRFIWFMFISVFSEEWRQTETNKQLNNSTNINDKTQFILGDFFCTNPRLKQCLYWEIAPDLGTQVCGHLAHQFSRDGLVQAAVSAWLLHSDEDPPDTRASHLATADLVRI